MHVLDAVLGCLRVENAHFFVMVQIASRSGEKQERFS